MSPQVIAEWAAVVSRVRDEIRQRIDAAGGEHIQRLPDEIRMAADELLKGLQFRLRDQRAPVPLIEPGDVRGLEVAEAKHFSDIERRLVDVVDEQGRLRG